MQDSGQGYALFAQELDALIDLGESGIRRIFELQKAALSGE